jgi:glycosyltransferase involved in cell wall biosynthesis
MASGIVTKRSVLQVLGGSAGGTARHVAQIVEQLDGRGGLVLDIAGPPGWPVRMPKPVFPVAIPNGARGHAPAVRALRALVSGGRYTVVHGHGLRAGLDCGIALRGTSVSLLASVHNLLRADVAGRARYSLYRWSEPLLLALASRVFAASEEIADSLTRTAPRWAHKVEVLHLGVGEPPPVRRDAADIRSELGLGPGDALVVTAARLAPQKALHVLLRAVARLPDTVVLAVLGEGPLEGDLRARAQELGIAGRVRWLGWRSEVAAYVAAADVFCLSSNWEACALAAQEAMQLGTTVVATDVGGMPELITTGRSGLLVPKGDDAALARALQEALSDPEMRAAMAAAARARLADAFSTERMLDRLDAAYRTASRAP